MGTYFEDIFAVFLSKITTFEEYTSLTEEELNIELKMLLKTAILKFISKKNLVADYDMECFNRELEDLEVEILACGMVVSWLTPKINNIELLKQSLSSKDFTFYSQANHLKEIRDLKADAEKDFQYWIGRYDLNRMARNGMK